MSFLDLVSEAKIIDNNLIASFVKRDVHYNMFGINRGKYFIKEKIKMMIFTINILVYLLLIILQKCIIFYSTQGNWVEFRN